jgi:nucleotide-binding universal stress UspA family protein
VIEAIVVPIDDSPTSVRALATATALARAVHVPVELVSVVSPGIDPLEATMALQRLVEEIDAPTSAPEVLFSNDVADALTDFAGRRSAVLCMATHGRGGISRHVLGSVAAEVLAKTKRSVVLVGPRAEPSAELTDIVVGVELSDAAADHVPIVLEWAVRTGARVHLINVLTDGQEVGIGARPTQLFLGDVAQRYRVGGADACTRVIDGDDVDELLNHVAAALGAGMVVVGGTRLGGSLADIGLGSVALRLVRHAPCPVLVIPPARGGEER